MSSVLSSLVAVALLGASTSAVVTDGPPPRRIVVVATTPDLAAIVREVGDNAVEVKALAKSTEDPHFVDAKPSHIVTLNRADVLVEGGAELEIGWLPPLLESARNDRIAMGAPGRIIASEGIRMLEVPATLDRSRGDVHALGNPHFLLDPGNVKIIATHIAEHLAQCGPCLAEHDLDQVMRQVLQRSCAREQAPPQLRATIMQKITTICNDGSWTEVTQIRQISTEG